MILCCWKFRLVGALLGLAVLWLTTGTATAQAQSVEYGMVGIPDGGSVILNKSFVLTLEAGAGGQEVDTAVVYLTFDPSVLQINPDSITVGDDLDFALEEIGTSFYTLDNVAGAFSYQAGILGGSTSGSFPLFSLEFMAVGVGESTISAVSDPDNDRYTAALRAGIDLLGSIDSAEIVVARDTGPDGPDDGTNDLYLPIIVRASLVSSSAAGVTEGFAKEEVAAPPATSEAIPAVAESDSDASDSQGTNEPQWVFLPTVLN